MTNLFTQIQIQLDANLPFVVYRKPDSEKIKLIWQNDDVPHYAQDLSESGFVFASFNVERGTMLIKFDNVLEEKYSGEEFTPAETMDIIYDSEFEHTKLVQKGIDAIQKGLFDKVVLSHYVTSREKIESPIRVFKNLLNTYQTAFVYLWYHPKAGMWLGATPEKLLEMDGPIGKTMSLAGTQLYTENVIWESKEQEEQKFVTKYIGEALKGKVVNYTETDPYTVQAGTLAHIKTDIMFTLKREVSLSEVVRQLHPTPAVCGTPKEEAKEFILENEGYDRSFYTGFLGELNLTKERTNNRRNTENRVFNTARKTSDLYVNLRCMQITNGEANIYVGGGITKDSDPKKEHQETINKSLTMRKVL